MNYIFGKIIWTSKKHIILESNSIGYKINVINGDNYILNKNYKIFIYKYSKIDHKNLVSEELYGFNSSIERSLFMDLIKINGIGNITAFNILNNDINQMLTLIVNNDISGLESLEYLNNKNAISICNSMSQKYLPYVHSMNPDTIKKNEINSKLVYALKKLGYKNDDLKLINDIKVEANSDLNELITESIKLIAIKHEQQNIN